MSRRARLLSVTAAALAGMALSCRSTSIGGTQLWPQHEPITLRWHDRGSQSGQRTLAPGELQHTRLLEALQQTRGVWTTSLVSYAPGQVLSFGDGDLRVNVVGKEMIVVDGARLEQWRLLGGAPRPLLELMAELAGMR